MRIGLGVGIFSSLLTGNSTQAQTAPRESRITILTLDGTSKNVLLTTPRHFEAPNWSPDGNYLLLNSEGKLWRLMVGGGEPTLVDTGTVQRINNDHGISPDGKTFAISAGPIYLLPSVGGIPRRVTEKSPSYFHGWSPDGRTLAYCAPREDNFDLYAISSDGGPERRLTTHVGYDDGPDYSPNGRWIYFNSDRSGSWDIWRIPADGAGPDDTRAEQVTNDSLEDWFPHPSPDGRWLLFLSFIKGTKGHPANQDVVLRMVHLPGATISHEPPHEVVALFGGQGTLNVNSWSPDSRRFAYVSYAPPLESSNLPAPWSSRDIGVVAVPGSAHEKEGTFTLTGTLDIWGKSDGFRFVHRPLDGDGQIIARVTAVQNTQEHAKAGVMIRESLAPDSRHATMVVTPADGTQFLRRKETGEVTINTNPGRNQGTMPYWVKLVRQGDRFTAYESTDGEKWVMADSDTVSMPRRVFLGLVASSHQKEVTNTSTLDHVDVKP
jgi:hypothetical protein